MTIRVRPGQTRRLTVYLLRNKILMFMIRYPSKALGPSLFILPILLAIGLSGGVTAARTPAFDCLIVNGLLLDGTGRSAFPGDLGIVRGRIAAIGRLDRFQALRTIDAKGRAVAPGFIDIHTHCDGDLLGLALAENFIRQGVTTVVGGNCGRHPYPLRGFFRRAQKEGISPNWGVFAGHNTIKEKVMAGRTSPPTAEDMRLMKALIVEEMMSGALGLSTGLSYMPGRHSDTEEVCGLAGAAGRLGGLYATHLRNQDLDISKAIREAVEVGRREKMPVQISHIKLADEAVWGRLDLIAEPLEEARHLGVGVTLDLYPYTASFMGLTGSFPPWSTEDGPSGFAAKLRHPDIFERVKSSVVAKRFRSARGVNTLRAVVIGFYPAHPNYEGLTVEQILDRRGVRPTAEAGAELLIELETNGGATAAFTQMDEADVEALIRRPDVMIASDAGPTRFRAGSPHPRAYGTFPRVVGRYVKDRRTLTLEEAIRKMTSLPAEVLKLSDRGTLKTGMWADIVVFDPTRFEDRSTFQDPHRYPAGLDYVFVNGEPVIEPAGLTGKKPGRVLYGPARRGVTP